MDTLLATIDSYFQEHIILLAILTFGITLTLLCTIAHIIKVFVRHIKRNVLPSPQKRIGDKEEQKIRKILKKLDKKEYITMHDLMLPSKTGTTQIDHLVISIHGIFVIETKNYSGSISGNPESKTLYQNIMCKGAHPIHNPIFQNYGHVCAVQELLKLPNKNNMYSLVLFGEKCELFLDKISPYVCSRADIIRRIEEIRGTYFTQETIYRYAKEIKKHNIKSAKARKRHIQDIKEKKLENGY